MFVKQLSWKRKNCILQLDQRIFEILQHLRSNKRLPCCNLIHEKFYFGTKREQSWFNFKTIVLLHYLRACYIEQIYDFDFSSEPLNVL